MDPSVPEQWRGGAARDAAGSLRTEQDLAWLGVVLAVRKVDAAGLARAREEEAQRRQR